jgi:two-component system KDP operon response regulator KdpE
VNSNKYKILVVEDDENINNLIATLIDTNGYKSIQAKDCSTGMMLYASHRPDLIILDLGLPDADGIELLKSVRKASLTPVIVLSARNEEAEKVKALDLGANDYVTKPFGADELMARIRTSLRISRNSSNDGKFPGGRFEMDGLEIDYDARRVFVEKNEIKLTQTEYNIIALLSAHRGKVLTYAFIIKEIWGYNDLGSTKKLQVNMANIRKKFGVKPGQKSYIENELGVGYRMCEQNN